jgi:Pectate lyase superfamily protein
MAAPDLTQKLTVFVQKEGTDDAGANTVGHPYSRLTIDAALADLADTSRYPAASATFPHIVAIGPGTFVLDQLPPPFTFFNGSCDGEGQPTTVLLVSADLTLPTAWNTNTTKRGGLANVTLQVANGTPALDLTMPVPVAGNPARTFEMFNVNHNLPTERFEATSTADVWVRELCRQSGGNTDTLTQTGGTSRFNSNWSNARATIVDKVGFTAVGNWDGFIVSATGASVTANSIALAGTTLRLTNSSVRSLVISETAPGVVAVSADTTSIPIRSLVSYTGLASATNLTILSDAAGVAYTPTTPGNWSPVPATVQAALDELGSGTFSVPNIAALEALIVTGLNPGTTVNVLGYYAPGDGKGGFFTFTTTSGATVDHGMVCSTPSGGMTRWLRNYTGPVNVGWLGCYGDGVHDDTIAFQNALTFAGLSQVCYAPTGTYVITSPLTFYGSFQGDPWTNTVPGIFTATKGTVIDYANATVASALVAGTKLFGTILKDFSLQISAGSATEVCIDFPLGGDENQLNNIFVYSASATPNQGIYLRGANPGTGLGNVHLFRNVVTNVFVVGPKVGLRIGDNVTDGVGISNVITNFAEGNTLYGIELTGYTNSIVACDFSAVGVRFFGLGDGNVIVGGGFDTAVAVQVTLDSDIGERNIVTLAGVGHALASRILDNIAPTNPERWAIVGPYTTIPAVRNMDDTYLVGFDTVNKRVVFGGSESAFGTTKNGLIGSVGFDGTHLAAADYAATPADIFIKVDATLGNVTVTLLDPAVGGPKFVMLTRIDTSANTVLVVVAGGKTIDGAASLALTVANKSAVLQDDAVNYFSVGRSGPDYEEGTWVPVPNGLTVVGAPTYTGTFTRIGRQIFATAKISSTTSTAATAGTTFFTGLPYVPIVRSTCVAANEGSALGLGTGLVDTGAGGAVFVPSWAAAPNITFSLTYIK